MKIIICCLLLAILIRVTQANAAPQIQEGWRLPIEADMTGDWADFRGKNERPYLARADLNGDGILDDAYIALSTRSSNWSLFVNLNSKQGEPRIIKLYEETGKTPPQNMGVAVAKPGIHKSACGKGYWPCAQGEPPELKLQFSAIDFFVFESANSFFWWDNRSGTFRRTWMSD